MLILKLWNYLRGYVIIRIEGLRLEKFINMCIKKDIYLWDIERLNYTTMQAKVSIRGYKILRKLSRSSGCKVYLCKKNGYPFWFSKIKKRKMLIIGAFFSLSLLIIFCSFVFIIKISGNENLSDEEIINALGNYGLKAGTNRYFLNLREIENNLLIELQELSWVGIEINGIVAKIEVVEKKAPPPQIDKDTPCDVVARKNGIIEKIIARNGDPLVKKGDIVSKGDLLITGVVERQGMEKPIYLHAYGEVYAKTYYEVSKTVNLIKKQKLKTGAKYTRRIVKIGELKLSLSKGDNPYEVFILEKTSKKPIIWRNKSLPVEIITEEIYEAIEVEEKLDVEETKNFLHQILIETLLEKIPKELQILNSNSEFVVKDNTLQGTLMIEVLEDIAEQRKLQVKED